MILQLPPGVTGPDGLKFRGRWLLQSQDGSQLVYEVSRGGLSTLVMLDPAEATLEIAGDAPPELIAALQAAIATHNDPPAHDAPAKALFALAQSAVGIRVQDLTAAQIRALQVLILWDRRAIDMELKVRPLKEWVKFRPVE